MDEHFKSGVEIARPTQRLLRSGVHRTSPLLAHRDGRRFDGQPSLSGHCGHGLIFIAPRSVANDPSATRPVEREYIFRLLQNGQITDEARRRIERELDLEEAGIVD